MRVIRLLLVVTFLLSFLFLQIWPAKADTLRIDFASEIPSQFATFQTVSGSFLWNRDTNTFSDISIISTGWFTFLPQIIGDRYVQAGDSFNLFFNQPVERIASLLAAANKKLDYSIEKTLQQIARHAFADPRVLFNSDGSMKKITELDEDAAAMIGGVELSGKRVKRVKITDALRALDMIMRSHKAYAEDRNIVDSGVKVIVLDMPRPDRSGFVNASPLPALPGPGNGNGNTR
jgi:hypothetical protein